MAGFRKRKRKGRFLGLFMVLFGLTACSGVQSGDRTAHTVSFFAMDTYMIFTAYGEGAEDALIQAENTIAELEGLWSVTDADSDIYAVNHSGGKPVAVDDRTEEILSFALDMAERTDGALDPTIYPVLTAWGFTTGENQVPSQEELTQLLAYVGYDKVQIADGKILLEAGSMLDLGAVGKGYAGDETAQVLKEDGITSALLDIGGNIQAIGTKPDGSSWRVGLKDPFSGGVLGVILAADQAVVTSGTYERYFVGEDGIRYGHILDPATGYPVDNGLASVSVIAGEGKLCDALSTSLFVMGMEDAIDYWQEHQDFDMILVTEEREIYLTEGMQDKFTLESGYGDMEVKVIER